VKNLAQHVGVLPRAARTAATASPDIRNDSGTGLIVVIDATAKGTAPSVTFTIEGKDPTSGKYYTILASAAVSTVSTTVLRVHPQLTAAANTVAKDMLPAVWRVNVTVGNADSLTYSVGASMVP
jgi:hypothetical protein